MRRGINRLYLIKSYQLSTFTQNERPTKVLTAYSYRRSSWPIYPTFPRPGTRSGKARVPVRPFRPLPRDSDTFPRFVWERPYNHNDAQVVSNYYCLRLSCSTNWLKIVYRKNCSTPKEDEMKSKMWQRCTERDLRCVKVYVNTCMMTGHVMWRGHLKSRNKVIINGSGINSTTVQQHKKRLSATFFTFILVFFFNCLCVYDI